MIITATTITTAIVIRNNNPRCIEVRFSHPAWDSYASWSDRYL